MLRARIDGMVDALNGAWSSSTSQELATLAPLARTMAEAACTELGGRPLFAAHAELPWPDEGAGHAGVVGGDADPRAPRRRPHRRARRRRRGAVRSVGVAVHLRRRTARDRCRGTRKWPDDEWAAAVESLASRGLGHRRRAARPTTAARGSPRSKRRTDELAQRTGRARSASTPRPRWPRPRCPWRKR